MNTVTTDKGTVTVGDQFRDNRVSNIRTLEVRGFLEDGRAECTVIRQEYQGEITHPNRRTPMTVERLLSRSFVRVDAEAVA
ncbi:hypothetical protein [Nocardia sp. NPDC127526]|uniref:hypothetical protein n=1 Tax=Nocardia sp. NPDC127526 TaxID=3345393 RepID=UPI0036403268